MGHPGTIPAHCPYCQSPMRVAAMECPVCAVEVRGRFRETRFQRLSPEDQELLERYLLSGFSIKALEERSGMGYAAIRSRLDRLISNYQKLVDSEDEKTRILNRLAEGEITASEAARQLQRL